MTAAALIEEHLRDLVVHGYSVDIRYRRRVTLEALASWIERRKITFASLEDRHVEEFVRRGLRGLRRRRGANACVRDFLEHLRAEGIAPQLASHQATASPADVVVGFEQFLAIERGLAQSTIERYAQRAREFLRRGARRGLRGISANAVVAAMKEALQTTSRAVAHETACALRVFLRFLHASGALSKDLSYAVPRVLASRHARLPDHLQPREVEALLRAQSSADVRSTRSAAIIYLLARLGLRAGEVVRLRIDDVDWRAATILVRGKMRRQEALPLPRDAGRALADYLRRRPRCLPRQIFICLHAPYRGFRGTRAVTDIVAEGLRRAGIHRAKAGAGLLRHSLATNLLRGGATLPEIGSVLRHRHAVTTRVYARVDILALRTIARPWPAAGRR